MTLPLSDIRVLDFCTVYAGPFAAMLMADQGADVIKVEAPTGDTSRGQAIKESDLSIPFLAFNRNKRSVSLDITAPEGRGAAYRLCESADVMIINTRVDGRKRRGFAYEDIAAINPRIIYVSLTGYGDDGPEANLPGIDIVIQGRAGDIDSRTVPGQEPPSHTPLFHFDMGTSLATCYAVMLALRDRERTGVGQKIETSLLQTALSLHALQMLRVEGVEERGPVRMTGFKAAYPAKDGRRVLNMSLNIAQRWENLRDFLGDEVDEDPRFATPEGRIEHSDEIEQLVARRYQEKTAAEWEAEFKTKGHSVSIIKRIDEVFDDSQVIANEMLTEFEQPGLGTVEAVSRPFRLSGTATEPWFRRPAPHLSEHADEVLREVGFRDAEIASMRAARVVG